MRAFALAGGIAAAAPAAALAANGGAEFVPTPRIDSVRCVAGCMSGGRVHAGGKLKLRGSRLSRVSRVVFQGGGGRRDDVQVRVRPASDRSLTVEVPFEAQSGPLMAMATQRVRSRRTRPVTVMPPTPPEPSAELSPLPGAPNIETATTRNRFFLGARGGVAFLYRVTGAQPAGMQVTLLRAGDGSVVDSWSPPPAPPGEVQRIEWHGTTSGGVAPEGRYAFRVSGVGTSGVSAADAGGGTRDSFDFFQHVFPVRGPHNYGQGGARFGAGRGGRSHQGHDVFARCGTKLVAARGGVVKTKQYHAAAGHYLVIDGDETGVDYFYAHLAAASPLRVGDRVYTGEQIGTVGDSGNASGCHLHFELWSAPGWYEGGRPFDPLPDLQAWDAYS